MKSFSFLFVVSSVMFSSVQAFAQDVRFTEARIFAPLKGSNATAGYAKIENLSNNTVEIKIVKAAPFKAVELHETLEKNGRMSMQKRESFKIEPKKTFEFVQGGNHIMLFDPSTSPQPNQTIAVVFKVDGKDLSVPFKIISRVPEAKPQHH